MKKQNNLKMQDIEKSTENAQGGKLKGKGMKIKNPKKTLFRLLSFIFKRHAVMFIVAMLCIVISAYASVESSVFINDVIIEITNQLESVSANNTYTLNGIVSIIIKMAIIFMSGVIATIIYGWFMAIVSQSVLRDIRNDMFIKMQKLPISYFDTHAFGDTMSHYTNDADALEQFISQGVPNLLQSLVTIVVAFIQMVVLSWQLTIVVIITVALMFIVIKSVAGNSAKYFVAQQHSMGKLNGFVEEMLNGQKVVKVFCHEQETKSGFDICNNELCDNNFKANKYANILMPIMGNLTYLQYVILAVVGGILAINGWLFVSDPSSGAAFAAVATFLLLSRAFTRPISMMSQQFNNVVLALAGAERIFELNDQEFETDNGYVTLVKAIKKPDGQIFESDLKTAEWYWKHPHHDGTLTYTKLEGNVYFDNVDFSYDGKKQVLKDITIDTKAGQKVAIIGKTGAGKTTISNLINRFYDIDDGKIRYDGININKIKKADLRKSLGVVLQEVNLFTGTVMDNVRYGKLDASEEEVFEACKLACADDFIMRLPDGYNTMLSSDGANLSQGQRQLLAIARVAIANPPVMILDEATSSIDTRTETIVQKGMDNLMKGRTVFVIAHRLSTIRNSDNIMVLDKGSIIEQGNHTELMKLRGAYYNLNSTSKVK